MIQTFKHNFQFPAKLKTKKKKNVTFFFLVTMFKKPIANLKTFSPLRSSDRRRFQNEAWEAYPELKDQQVMPEDLRSAKFTTHAGNSGVLYIADNHQPLWLSIGNLPPVPTGKHKYFFFLGGGL